MGKLKWSITIFIAFVLAIPALPFMLYCQLNGGLKAMRNKMKEVPNV